MIKSSTTRRIFKECPEVKKLLWGGKFRLDGFFANTVSKHGDESVIRNYVKNQGSDAKYMKLHDSNQLMIFILRPLDGVFHFNQHQLCSLS